VLDVRERADGEPDGASEVFDELLLAARHVSMTIRLRPMKCHWPI